MLELITAEEAAQQIRGDATADGPWLAVWIPAVSEAVRSWLKEDWRLYTPAREPDGTIIRDSDDNPVPEEDSDGPVVNPIVKAAALLELASQYRFREGGGDNAVQSQEGTGFVLSRGATMILTALRKPTVA